jgi:hypothetical protein
VSAELVGVLCWHGEDPDRLHASVESLAQFCDAIVAVDGACAYGEPACSGDATGHRDCDCSDRSGGLDPRSSSGEVAAIFEAAGDVPISVYQPDRHWSGEIQKHEHAVARARTTFRPVWLFMGTPGWIFDVPADLRDRLQATSRDVCSVEFECSFRRFARADAEHAPGIGAAWARIGADVPPSDHWLSIPCERLPVRVTIISRNDPARDAHEVLLTNLEYAHHGWAP